MNWPFVRRSKYEKMVKVYHQLHDINTKYIDHNRQLCNENDSLCQEIEKKDDIIAKLDALKNEYSQLNHDNLVGINRLNQELASELNSHRETKEQKNELSAECDRLYDEVDNLKKELEETKECFNYTIDGLRIHNNNFEKELEETKEALKIAQEYLEVTKAHEQKLFEAHDKLNQQNMGLLFENEKLSKQINQLRFDKSHLKQKIKKLESKIVLLDADYEIMKKNADWFYGCYCRFKDMIEKSGYFLNK